MEVLKGVDLAWVFHPRQPGVKIDAHDGVGNVGRRHGAALAEPQLRRPLVLRRLTARRPDSPRQQAMVEGGADHLHMSGLFIPGQIAAAAKVKVARADRQARAEPVEGFQCRQARPRGLGQIVLRVRQQIGDALGAAAPHAASQLMQLRQAEPVGSPDQHGVGARHIKTALDDVGGQKDVAIAVRERHHHPVHRLRLQAAMGDLQPELGREGAQLFGDRLDVLDAGNDDEALTVAAFLPHQRRPHRRCVIGRQEGADGSAPRGWAGDHADLLQTDHRRLQRAGYGGRGEGQQMAAGGEASQLRLDGGAELLLLIDDHQSKVVKAGLLGGQRVGADDDAGLARGERGARGPRLGRRHQTRKLHDAKTRAGEAPF